ncbi:MAG: hypothetical protein ACTHMQ_13650 [Protaetiibacter sp.]
MKRMTLRLERMRERESGYALLVVIGLGAVMALLISTALVFTVSGTQKSQTEVDWTGALAAANAGVEDYRSRIQNDIRYVKYGNKDAPFTKNSPPASGRPDLNASLVLDPDNPAFGIGTSGTWASVPGSGGKAQFRYAVSVQNYGGTGVVQVQATGKVGESTRSIVVELKQQGLTQFVYFSDYETSDPSVNGSATCDSYRWQSPRNASSSCDISFFGKPSNPSQGDQILGMIHSNDQIVVCGATFGEVVQAWADDTRAPTVTTCGTNGVYKKGVVHGPKYELKASTAELKAETTLNDPAAVPSPGCLYTGPTTIKLESNGWMRVWSPLSKETQVTLNTDGRAVSGAGTADDGQCGRASDLQSSAGAFIRVLDMNLVYVQGVPVWSNDVNYSTTTSINSKINCSSDGTSWRFTTDQAQPNPTGYSVADKRVIRHPLSGTYTESMSAGKTPKYSCTQGDVFVSGTLSGRMTIAADRYFWVTGDITYSAPNADLLGIVGQQGIVVWNPVNSSGSTLLSDTGREIYGALTSNKHTIQVQNYDSGSTRGTLHIFGSMAMKYRGPVGTLNTSTLTATTGYIKYYEYDPKLVATNPPKYKVSTVSTFLVTRTAAVPAAYNADGSPR